MGRKSATPEKNDDIKRQKLFPFSPQLHRKKGVLGSWFFFEDFFLGDRHEKLFHPTSGLERDHVFFPPRKGPVRVTVTKILFVTNLN